MKSKAWKSWLVLTVTALAGGCASFSPPERPAYTGTDQVGSVSADQIAGVWTVRELNPIPGSDESVNLVTIEYADDGRATGSVEPNEQMVSMGITGMTMLSDWRVDGDQVTHENVEMQTEGDSAFGNLVAGFVNRSSRDLGGTANVYELSDDRIVMVGDDGAAMEYTRQ